MVYLLDTNVVSELRKVRSGKADSNVASWIGTVDAGALYLSVVSILELEMGVLQMERRDPGQGALLRTWLDKYVLSEFVERVIPVDIPVARRCARLHVPDPLSERDAIIAATAVVHGMTVVTRNVSDFSASGVSAINPWVD
ncbi:MAG: type II toxin-antitoxin system VapC family toxin [Gammaproteobacteria bacterium]|nr:type II toxin-antitoxin system VapC family toxin [Gammaproteobacteria bacterium]